MRFAARPVIHQPHCCSLLTAHCARPRLLPARSQPGPLWRLLPRYGCPPTASRRGQTQRGPGRHRKVRALLLAVGCVSSPGQKAARPWPGALASSSMPCASSRRRLPAIMRGSIHQGTGVSFAPPPTRQPNRLTFSIRCIPAIRSAMYSPVDGAFPLPLLVFPALVGIKAARCNATRILPSPPTHHTHIHRLPTPVRCRHSLIAPPIVHLPLAPVSTWSS